MSSPNTPGLRDLQGEAFLDDLLARVIEARDAAAPATAILLKIAPDITLETLDAICATAARRGVQALVVSNTTIARPANLAETALAKETGGLSGRPLFGPATRMLARTRLRVGATLPLIGVGGVDSADAAWTKIRAGASLVAALLGADLWRPGAGRIDQGRAAGAADGGGRAKPGGRRRAGRPGLGRRHLKPDPRSRCLACGRQHHANIVIKHWAVNRNYYSMISIYRPWLCDLSRKCFSLIKF